MLAKAMKILWLNIIYEYVEIDMEMINWMRLG